MTRLLVLGATVFLLSSQALAGQDSLKRLMPTDLSSQYYSCASFGKANKCRATWSVRERGCKCVG
jgi:hypothetical protein